MTRRALPGRQRICDIAMARPDILGTGLFFKPAMVHAAFKIPIDFMGQMLAGGHNARLIFGKLNEARIDFEGLQAVLCPKRIDPRQGLFADIFCGIAAFGQADTAREAKTRNEAYGEQNSKKLATGR